MNPPDLSDAFFVRWLLACARLEVDPLDLLCVAYSESGCRADAHNPHGDAVGLIQFMPATLKGLGWTAGHETFRHLSAEEQVPFVEAYFRPWAHGMGLGGERRPLLTSAPLCYVATFLPGRLGGAVSAGLPFVLCAAAGPLAWAYNANTVLDRDKDGAITVGDLARHLELQCHGARWDAIVETLRRVRDGMDAPTVRPVERVEPDAEIVYALPDPAEPPDREG